MPGKQKPKKVEWPACLQAAAMMLSQNQKIVDKWESTNWAATMAGEVGQLADAIYNKANGLS